MIPLPPRDKTKNKFFGTQIFADNRRQRLFTFKIVTAGVHLCLKTQIFPFFNFDELVKSRNSIEFVIPAQAGIQLFQDVLDPGFRRGDDLRDFLRDHQL